MRASHGSYDLATWARNIHLKKKTAAEGYEYRDDDDDDDNDDDDDDNEDDGDDDDDDADDDNSDDDFGLAW